MRNFLAVLLAVPGAVFAQKMEKAEEPNETGLVQVSLERPSMPAGLGWMPIDDTKFSAKLPIITVGDLEGSEPYLFSVFVRSNAESIGRASCETDDVYYGKHTPLRLPATNGEWKQVSCFFRSAPGTAATMIRFSTPRGDEVVFEVKEPKFRRASEEEFTAAWNDWRAQYPQRDLSPRLTDGANLGRFVSMLENPPVGVDELRVIGIGSSYTNMLGNGERLVQWVRKNYPKAPKVVYEKHVGSAVAYDFTRGWMRQHVLERKPDLVILYSEGRGEDLEKLLADFRSHCAADVIVASLHLRERAGEISEAAIHQEQWKEVRAVAEKYGCEWVDNRVEWADYLRANEETIQWLIKDAVHQNDHGALVINENIVRHIVPNGDTETKPRDESIPASGGPISVNGYRVDLIGRHSPDGGKANVLIDGKPGDEFPAFVTTLIKPGAKNNKPARGSAADRSPHMVRLGAVETIIPQEWKIVMTSDTGDFKLVGSVTGDDGGGNNSEDVTSDSGQITVPTALWRRRLDDGVHTNKTGDVFSWEVKLATIGEIDFSGEEGKEFVVTIGTQLPMGPLEIEVGEGKGEILGYRVFQPYLQANQ